MQDINRARAEIVRWFQRVYDRGLTTSSGGNISLRVGGHIVITPAGGDKGALTPADCAVAMLADGSVLEGRPSCELPMHLAVYRARPDVTAILHAHPVHLCAFSVIDTPLRTDLFAEDYLLVPHMAVVPYFSPSSDDLAIAAAQASPGAQALLLRRHGVMTLGADLAQCFGRLECLEHTARIQWMCLGRKDARPLNDAQKQDLDCRFRPQE